MLNNFNHFNKFILRIPHNPLDKAFEAFNHKNFVQEILLKDSFFLESIFVASIDVYNAILKYDKLSEEKKKHLEITVLKYWLRSSTRCTPFGQFSGVSIGHFENKTSIKSKLTSRSINLDIGLLKDFSSLVSQTYKKNNKILFYPNSTIYRVLDEIRYIEYYFEKGIEKFMLSRVNHNYYTNLILDFTKNGKTFNEIHYYLKELILNEGEIIIDGASIGFIEKLITSQLLVNNLEPIITGDDYFDKILSISKNVNSSAELINIKRILEVLNLNNNSALSGYEKILKIKEGILPANNDKNIFHINLIYKFKTNTLNSSIPKKLKKAIGVIHKLCPAPKNIFLENFKKEFLAKYCNNEVPISILFDNEVGLDFFKNLNDIDYIEELNFNTNTFKYINNPYSEFLFDKLEIVFKENKSVLELFDEEINNLKLKESLSLHNTFSCFIEVYNNPEKIFVSEIGGSSAANYISRFSLDDLSFETLTKEIITKESEIEKNNIIAEINHLPQSKKSNVISRKVNREYVIEYLSNPTSNKNKISISDLFVKIENEKIVLFSKTLNKEITPILTSAHNYDNSTFPIYKFLCSLQDQHYTTSLSFYWGNYFKNYKWLPRVSYKNFILSKSRWILKYDELISIKNIDEFKANLKLPRYIEIGNDDKRLLIDLNSTLSFEILLSYAKNRKVITVIEYLFNTENGLPIDNNKHSNEYIISYYRNEK
ncbi:MAG: lantibiotic dehydratase family protein [Flavobacteriaceae bacterium]|nr:lantibiotic dehydratase family protein [Flavobacteriaceae bacterium]